MSNLLTIPYQEGTAALPQHSEIVDHENPLIKSSNRFRPVQDIAKQLHDYSFAVVDHIEKAVQLKKDSGWEGDKFGGAYKRFDSKSDRDDLWRIKKTDDGSIYTIGASRPDGAWEAFSVKTDANKKPLKAKWIINGFLPGHIHYDPNKAASRRVRLNTLNIGSMGRYSSDYLRHDSGLLRIHKILVSQAQAMIDFNKQYKFTGNGLKLGDHKFYVHQLNKQTEGKAYVLRRDHRLDPDDTLSSIVVKTNAYGEISEILQTNKRANVAFMLVRNSMRDISESAELIIINKADKARLDKALEDFSNLEELFEHSEEMTQRLAENRELAIKEYFANQETHSIIVPDNSAEAREAKSGLLSQSKIETLMTDLNMVVRPPKSVKNIPKELQELYDYAQIDHEQFSFALFTGGVNKTKFQNGGNPEALETYGPVNLRRRFQTKGDHLFKINDEKLGDYLRSIGIKLTSPEQDKAVMRWILMQNKDLLKEQGILIEKTGPRTEKLHFVNLSSRPNLRRIKVNIATMPGNEIKKNLLTYPKFDFIKALKEKHKLSAPESFELNSIEEFKIMLKEIGFEFASPTETEEYIAKELQGNEKAQMQDFLKARVEYHEKFYQEELATVILAKHLRNQGYEGIKKHNVKTATYLQAKKGEQKFLARALTHKDNLGSKRKALIELAQQDDRTPLLYMAKDINNETRTIGELSLVT